MSKANLDKKPADVAAMFDEVAPTYDLTNALLSFGQDRRWHKIVRNAVSPKSGQKILDLAAGTGASSVAFLKPGVKVVAGDFSEGMLAVGRQRHPEIEFVFADATKLPFADGEFEAVTISFGFYNFYLNKVLPAFSSLASKTPEASSYLSESILAWPNQHELKLKIEKAGYTDVTFRNLTFGIVAVHEGTKAESKAGTK